jgi:hypothetical protein
MVVANNKNYGTKSTCQKLAILMAMRIRQSNAGRIPQWSAFVALCKATRCRHWASAHAVLPRRLPWLTILNETKKHLQNTTFIKLSYGRPMQKSLTISGPKTDPLLTSLMQQAPYKCETLAFKLKSSATF